MANYQHQIKLGYSSDNTSLTQLRKNLQEIIDLSKQPGYTLNKDLQEAVATAQKLQDALKGSLNTKTNTLNTAKLNQELKKTGESLSTIKYKFESAGAAGANAYNTLASSAVKANTQIKKSNALLDSFAVSMANTVKWGITSGIWNNLTNSLSGAVSYVEKLDRSLNNIRIVTEKNTEAMREFAREANAAAQKLGTGTTSYTDASLIYYQQGLSDAEVKARTEVTLKAANVTGQSADAVSEQLTAVWNGYKVTAQEAELYVDKLAAVAATTAADLEELSTGMSKVASAANSMGVDIDQLNAQLATVVSVTRQAPESVGTALKTIYARMGDLAIGDTDEFGVDLGTVSGQLAQVGINVLDQTGNLRDMGVVMEEVAEKWNLWNDSQRTAVAIAMAGKRQYNNLIALFENWDMYSDALNTSANSMGTLQKQQDIYMERTDTKLQQVRTSWEKLYSTVIDTNELNTGIDAINQLVQSFDNLASAFGGGVKSIATVVGLLASLGSNQIGDALINRSKNKAIERTNASTIDFRNQAWENGLLDLSMNASYKEQVKAANIRVGAEEVQSLIGQYDKYKAGLSNEEYTQVLQTARQIADLGYEIEAQKLINEAEIDNIHTYKNILQQIKNIENSTVLTEEQKEDLIRQEQLRLEQLKKTRGKISDLEKKSSQELDNQVEALEEQNRELGRRYTTESQTLKNNLEDTIGSEEQLQKQARIQNSVDMISGSFQALAGSIAAVNSVYDIWANDSLTLGEQLTQTFMALAPAIPTIVSGFKKIYEVNKSIIAARGQEAAATLASAGAKGVDAAATKADEEALEDVNEELGKSIVLRKGETAATSGGMAAAGATVAAGVAIAAVVAAIAAITIYMKKQREAAEKELKAAEELSQKTLEKAEKDAEVASKVKELANSYEDLASQHKDQEISLTELRNKTYDLCLQYGQEDLALKTLVASYEDLNQIMREAQIEANNTALASARASQAAAGAAATAATDKFITDQDWSFENIGRIKIPGQAGFYKDGNAYFTDQELQVIEQIESIAGDIFDETGEKKPGGSWQTKGLFFDTEEHFDTILENWDEISSLIVDNYDLEGIKPLYDFFFNTINKQIEQGLGALEQQQQLIKSNISTQANIEDIVTAEDYLKQKRSLVRQAVSAGLYEDTEEGRKAAEKWATSYLLGFEEIVGPGIQGEIADALGVVTWALNNWTEDEKNYIYLHLDTVQTLGEAEALLRELESYFEFSAASRGSTIADQLMQQDAISEADIENLYTTNFGDVSGVKQAAFSSLNIEQQKQLLLQYQLENTQKLLAIQEQVQNELNTSIEEFKQQNAEIEQKYQDALDNIKDGLEGKTEDSFDIDVTKLEAKDIAEWTKNYDKLTDAQKEVVDNLVPPEFKKAIKNYADYQEQLTSMSNALTEVSNAQHDYETSVEEAERQYSNSVNSLSEMNSAYDSLNDIIDGYNERGHFTIDNLITMMQLQPEYLATLQFENGQLVMNQEAMSNLAIAKLKEAQASIIVEAQAKLAAYAEDKARIAANNAEAAVNSLIPTLESGAAAWREYWSAAHGDSADEYEQQINKATEMKLTAIDNLIGEINSGNLAGAFGAEAKEELEKIFKEWDEEFDRYWTQTKKIEKLTDTIEDLRDAREHLSGDELRDSLEAENQLLDKQKVLYDELLKAQEAEQKELQNELQEYGVKFNKAGEITNYEAVTKAQTDIMNSAGDEDAEEYFNNFKDALERYDTLVYDEMKETLDEIEELSEQKIDNNFEIWTSQMEDFLDDYEDARDLNNFNADMAKDFKQVYEDLGLVKDNLEKNFTSMATETVPTIIMDMQKAEREIASIAAGTGSTMFHSMSQAQEYLEEKQEELQEAALETKEIYEELYETYLDQIDQAIDKMDDLYDEFERINDNLEFNAELIELVYGEKAYNLYSELYQAQLHTSTEHIASLMQEKEMYERLYAQAEEGTQDQLKYKERLYELESEINDKVIEHIELLKEDYANTIETILNNLENEMTDGLGLDYLEEEWDRIKEKADKYYDTVEGLYHIQSLSNEINNSMIDATDRGKQKLQALYDREIEYLREKKNLTEYDIQAAEARYQITLKEIALEEAQQAKNTMKLVRDSNGNWTYQYVANQDEIMNKQQELMDAYQELYNLSNEAYTNNIDSLFTLQKEYLESAREIANDETLTEEKKVAKLEKLRDDYIEDYQLLIEENELYSKDLAENYSLSLYNLFEINNENLNDMSTAEKDIVAQMLNSNQNEFLEMINWLETGDGSRLESAIKAIMSNNVTSWNTDAQTLISYWKDPTTGVESKINSATQNMVIEIGKFNTAIGDLAKNTGIAFDTESGIIGNFNAAEGAATSLRQKVEEEVSIMESTLTVFAEAVASVSTSWSNVVESVGAALTEYKAYKEYVDQNPIVQKIITVYEEHGGGGDAGGTTPPPGTGGDLGGSGGTLDEEEPQDDDKEDPLDNDTERPDKPLLPEDYIALDGDPDPQLSQLGGDPDFQQWYSQKYGGTEFSGKYNDDYAAVEDEYWKFYNNRKTEHENITNTSTEMSNSYPVISFNNDGVTKVSQGSALTIDKPLKDSNSNGNKDKKSFGEKAMDVLESIGGWIYDRQQMGFSLFGYDTGGYTGDWGSTSGRIALLHQKELVLNQSDTKNFLAAVSTMRSITGLNSSVNDAIMHGISKMMLEMSNMNTHANYNTEASKSVGDTIYEIHAEFPDANDVNSIREAILSLPNLASQRVSKYNTP